MRAIDPDMDPAIVSAIDARLDAVERDHDARILFAIESGSRAWGFPSPDSDYDCRFVYAHPIRAYARLRPPRDVIETPLDAIFDVNGWDLRKALLLALKGNAVIVEWARAPIIYRAAPEFLPAFRALLDDIVDPALAARHYAGLARSQQAFDGASIKLKKLFYVLRPLMALRWMQARGWGDLPPMNFMDLLAQSTLEPELRAQIDALLAQKRQTSEMGSGAAPADILAFIRASDALMQEALALPARRDDRHARAQAFLDKWLS